MGDPGWGWGTAGAEGLGGQVGAWGGDCPPGRSSVTFLRWVGDRLSRPIPGGGSENRFWKSQAHASCPSNGTASSVRPFSNLLLEFSQVGFVVCKVPVPSQGCHIWDSGALCRGVLFSRWSKSSFGACHCLGPAVPSGETTWPRISPIGGWSSFLPFGALSDPLPCTWCHPDIQAFIGVPPGPMVGSQPQGG